MNDQSIKNSVMTFFKTLIACLTACITGIVLFIIINYFWHVFGWASVYSSDFVIVMAFFLIAISWLMTLAFIGNLSIALCAKSIKSTSMALTIGGLTGAVSISIIIIIYQIYYIGGINLHLHEIGNIVFLIIYMTIGFIFGSMGSYIFTLYDKKYLGRAGPEKKHAPISTVSMAVVILIMTILSALLIKI